MTQKGQWFHAQARELLLLLPPLSAHLVCLTCWLSTACWQLRPCGWGLGGLILLFQFKATYKPLIALRWKVYEKVSPVPKPEALFWVLLSVLLCLDIRHPLSIEVPSPALPHSTSTSALCLRTWILTIFSGDPEAWLAPKSLCPPRHPVFPSSSPHTGEQRQPTLHTGVKLLSTHQSVSVHFLLGVHQQTVKPQQLPSRPRCQGPRRCHINFMANSVKFPPSHKEEVQTNSEAIKGGPLGISNQESQQDLFLFHEEISKDKFFSTCDLTLLFFLEGFGDRELNRFNTLDTNPITPSSENFLSASCMLTSGS